MNNHRRTVRVLVTAALVAVVFAFVPVADAVESGSTFTFDSDVATRGRTVTVEDARFGLRSGIAEPAFTFTVTTVEAPAALPKGWSAASEFFNYKFNGDQGLPVVLNRDLWVSIPYTARDITRVTSLFRYDPSSRRWVEIRTGLNRAASIATTSLNLSEATLVVGESDFAHVGVASWYRSQKYPNGAAYNLAPVGSRLLVENLDNGKKTIVTIVSRGPFVRGRVIDLTHQAFQRIAPRGAGLARVKVKPLNPTVAGAESESAPPIVSPAAVVLDASTQSVRFAKDPDTPRPIASLTKLVAASVFLDTETPMDKIVTYEAGDRAICSCLRVAAGETLRVKDLFTASLVGSANNAMNALVRASGLSRTEFVRRMNEKAKAWGLVSASFVEPTGLDARNIASAHDAARLATKAFEDDRIAKTTTFKEYAFSTLNTKQLHTIRNRNEILGQPFAVTGAKTGYIEESGYCLATKAEGQGGSGSVVIIVLSSPTGRQRYEDTTALLRWAL